MAKKRTGTKKPTPQSTNHGEEIRVRGARVHNLKDVNVEFPARKLVVVTGLSGSGKSSLAFDTIFAEGQRRYVESLSSYARQFLGQMEKPEVDHIDGLSPAVAIDQKSTSRNPRSTVGTITEIYDHLRLLFARVGTPHCPQCGKVIAAQSPQQIAESIAEKNQGANIAILAPVVRGRKGSHEEVYAQARKGGYARIRVNGETVAMEEAPKLEKNKKHEIEIVVDRLKVAGGKQNRLVESVETALKLGEGLVGTQVSGDEKVTLYSEALACTECEISVGEVEPRAFSFNSPFGACETCHGLGVELQPDPALVIPDPELSLQQGAIAPWGSTTSYGEYYGHLMSAVIDEFKLKMTTPWKKLPEEARHAILHGYQYEVTAEYKNRYGRTRRYATGFEGVIPYLVRKHKESESDSARERIEGYMREIPCSGCRGSRLKPAALSVRIGEHTIASMSNMNIAALHSALSELELDERDELIATRLLKETRARVRFLLDVGLEYLTLHRAAATLSGGEAQRIRLATQVGSGLTGVLYVLDEPSIGLHQRDNTRLLETLTRLRDLGNTVLVVEHDLETIEAADWIIDVGPLAGEHGGEIMYSGPVKGLYGHEESPTAMYLDGRREIPTPNSRRNPSGKIRILDAQENNLRGIDVEIPLGVFTAVTGVSGSGKSSLVNEIVYPVLANQLNGARLTPGRHRKIEGVEQLIKVVHVDQSPIGRTPRSNPATYTGVFDHIRNLFAQTPEAKLRGYGPGRFSFNVKGGRCESCAGDGTIKIEMNFLPDVYVPCEECKGARYNRETLEVKLYGKNISEILETPIEEALQLFAKQTGIKRYLQTLSDVGLGYIRLGQPAPWLSGGEAQRVKLATELHRRNNGETMYLLDEPTTGLHFEDVAKLLHVLDRLVEQGNSVLVIEHNLDVVRHADWVIDLGPEGGDLGGNVVGAGTPESLATLTESHTGRYLAQALAKHRH